MFGILQKLKSGRWIVEYKEGIVPFLWTRLYPIAPWLEVNEDHLDSTNDIVLFQPVLYKGIYYAEPI
jgi:hypothetical protein